MMVTIYLVWWWLTFACCSGAPFYDFISNPKVLLKSLTNNIYESLKRLCKMSAGDESRFKVRLYLSDASTSTTGSVLASGVRWLKIVWQALMLQKRWTGRSSKGSGACHSQEILSFGTWNAFWEFPRRILWKINLQIDFLAGMKEHL